MPTGKVKWYDAEKGFGFISRDDGGDVYVRSDAVPAGATLKSGTKVEFGIVEGRRGEQALQVRIVDPLPSVAKATRPKPEEMVTLTEDLIKMMDGLSNSYRRGRHPDTKAAHRTAQLLRALADKLDA